MDTAYQKLDIVACDGAAFIARHDGPGRCPGDGWQLISRQGKPGRKGELGERGPRGEKGEPGEMPRIVATEINENYDLIILRSDNTREVIALRPGFERFLAEVGEIKIG